MVRVPQGCLGFPWEAEKRKCPESLRSAMTLLRAAVYPTSTMSESGLRAATSKVEMTFDLWAGPGVLPWRY